MATLAKHLWSLDLPLCRFSEGDPWFLYNAFEGLHFWGRSGSGKSTSARIVADAFLCNGFAGLVLTAKRDEVDEWRKYAAETKRDDLIVFEPGNGLKFNFLDYELNRPGAGAGLTENVVEIFTQVMQGAGRMGSSGSSSEEPFWEDSKTVPR